MEHLLSAINGLWPIPCQTPFITDCGPILWLNMAAILITPCLLHIYLSHYFAKNSEITTAYEFFGEFGLIIRPGL